MKVALLGATGFVGSASLKEALDRGHMVTAIVRHPEKLEKRDATALQGSEERRLGLFRRVRGYRDRIVSCQDGAVLGLECENLTKIYVTYLGEYSDLIESRHLIARIWPELQARIITAEPAMWEAWHWLSEHRSKHHVGQR